MKIRASRKINFIGRPKQPKVQIYNASSNASRFQHKFKNVDSLKATGVSWHEHNVVTVKPSK